ncbi:MAG: response regulator transcription factor [Burkholderiales bacterium]|nr:MAG: response regulator transcription factor [Burkholderiales bacterium]
MLRTPRVLLVEDEALTQGLLRAFLEKEGLAVEVASGGEEMLRRLDSEDYRLVLLDLCLPDEDGLVLLRRVRNHWDVPVIVVTSRTDRSDRLTALELGADDYLTKPFDPQELLLRVRNLISRSAARIEASAGGERRRYEFNGWTLDVGARTLVAPNGVEVVVTRGEFDILAALARSPNRVLSRAQILDIVSHGIESPSERTIDVLISRIRRKAAAIGISADPIATVPGFGYKLRIRN